MPERLLSPLSKYVIPPLSWALDRVGLHSRSDDLDAWAARRGWWHR